MNQSSVTPNIPGPLDKPHLPAALVHLVLLLIFTQFCALLMNQPAAFWLDRQYASLELPFRFLLLGGSWIFFAIAGVYLIIAGLLMRKLRVLAGLSLAAILAVPHAIALYRTTLCGFHSLYEIHGKIGCYAFRFVPSILFFLVFWLILFADRLPAGWVSRTRRPINLLSVFWVFLMGFGLIRAAFPAASPWQPLAPAHSPGPRSMTAIAYDSQRQRAVLFGGVSHWDGTAWVYDNSTWEWDGKDWQRIETPIAPSGRIRHAMAYDEVSEKVILYGGENSSGTLADLWEWDGRTWHRLCPVCNPAARIGHKMIYDPVRQRIIIYGGWNKGEGYAEGWMWDGFEWTYFQFDEAVPALYEEPMIYDSDRNRIVSFMGDLWGGTWIWKTNQWYKLDSQVSPPLRKQATLTYDPLNQYAILFGGGMDDSVFFDDTWILDGQNWTKLVLPLAPPQRIKAASFYDPIRNSVIVYGGEKLNSIYGDMWELKLTRGNLP